MTNLIEGDGVVDQPKKAVTVLKSVNPNKSSCVHAHVSQLIHHRRRHRQRGQPRQPLAAQTAAQRHRAGRHDRQPGPRQRRQTMSPSYPISPAVFWFGVECPKDIEGPEVFGRRVEAKNLLERSGNEEPLPSVFHWRGQCQPLVAKATVGQPLAA